MMLPTVPVADYLTVSFVVMLTCLLGEGEPDDQLFFPIWCRSCPVVYPTTASPK